jgi:zinc protease
MRQISPFALFFLLCLGCRPSPAIPFVKNNSSTAPATAPTSEVVEAPKSLPGLVEASLDNGLRVYLYELRELPLASIVLVSPAGSVFDPPEKNGLAYLTSKMLSMSSGDKNADALREQIDTLGATLSTSSFVDDAEVSISGLSRDLSEMLQIVSDIAQRPALSQSDFDAEKERLLIEAKEAQQDYIEVANNAARAAVFGSHPYAMPPLGVYKTNDNITLEDVKKFYQTQYTPKESALVIVGDFDTQTLLPEIKKIFSSWKGEAIVTKITSAPPRLSGRKILLIESGGDAVEIRVVAPMMNASHPDAPALDVVNDSLGGGFSSRLLDELRVNLGITYDVASVVETYKSGGWMSIETSTTADNTRVAVDAILKSLGEHRAIGPTKEDLEGAKAFFLVDTARLFETPDSLAGVLSQSIGSGAGPESLAAYSHRIENLTRAKAAKVLEENFPTGKDDVAIVVVGPTKQTKALLSGLGEITVLPRP